MEIRNCLVFLLLFVCSPALATDYYVKTGGNNTLDGLSDANAWETISKVNASSFSPGDNIYLNRGDTWVEQLLIPSSGTDVGGYITFGAYGTGVKPILDGTGLTLSNNHGLIRGSSKNYIIIDNIRVQDSGVGDTEENTGIGFFAGSFITVQNCETYNTESAGLKFNTASNVTVDSNEVSEACQNSMSESISLSGVDTFEVKNNTVHDNGTPVAGGAGIDAKSGSHSGSIHHNEVYNIDDSNAIYVDAYADYTYDIDIYSNYVHDNEGAGIQLGSETGGLLENISVHHNIVINCAKGGMAFHNEYPSSGNVQNITVYNNTFWGNGTNGAIEFGGLRVWDQLILSVTFKNNVFSDGHNFQLGIKNITADKYTVDYNVIDGVQGNVSGYTAVTGTNAIESDPLFVSTSDFHLQSASPAIGTCDSSVWQGTPNVSDYDGVAITDSSGNVIGDMDCGALSYVSGDLNPVSQRTNLTGSERVTL